MSNQVYASPSRKFFAQAGVNNFELIVSQTIAAQGSIPVKFQTDLEQMPENVSVNLSSGQFVFLEEGVYAIEGYYEIVPFGSVTDLDIEVVYAVGSDTSSEGTNIARTRMPFPNVKAGVGSVKYVIMPLTTTAFFQAGDSLNITMYNWDDAAHVVTLTNTNTYLQITRIY